MVWVEIQIPALANSYQQTGPAGTEPLERSYEVPICTDRMECCMFPSGIVAGTMQDER